MTLSRLQSAHHGGALPIRTPSAGSTLAQRNQEKANSMLFRFRESKMASLGLAARTGQRPKMVSSVSDLRACERYRGDLLKEISRKVRASALSRRC